jgi:hypothetical protein
MTNSGADAVKQTKRCCTCKEHLPVTRFNRNKSQKDGFSGHCRSCTAIVKKNYRETHKEKLRQDCREYHKTEKYKQYRKAYLSTPKERAKQAAWRKEYREKKKQDPQFMLNFKLSQSIKWYFKVKFNKPTGRLRNILGYGVKELRAHLEAKFKDGMTWDNYGSYWHIDHITPKSWFKYESVEDEAFKQCWGLDNLQPLTAKENITKGNRYAG